MTASVIACLVVAILMAGFARSRARMRAAAAAPPSGTPRLSRDELIATLRAKAGPESAIQLDEEGDRIVLSWRLVGIPWATLLFRRKLRETAAIELKIGEDAVQARVKRGKVEWETHAATWMPRAKIAWKHDRFPEFGSRLRERPPEPTAESPRDSAALVEQVRPLVLACGFRFEPVLEFAT